ncbi:hypothetical protein D3C86_1101300 [compost metagenome]
MGKWHRRWVDPAGDQPGKRRHVGHEYRVHLVGDGAEPREVQRAGIGRAARDDELGPLPPRDAFDFVHAHPLRRRIHSVAERLEPPSRHIDLGAVGQVSSGLEIKAEDLVPWRQQRQIDGLVGLAAGVRLHVGVTGAEKTLGPIDGDLLGDVDVPASAVIAPARVALGVLVREYGSLGIEHRSADEVLRCDELDRMHLTAPFGVDGGPDVPVGLLQAKGADSGKRLVVVLCNVRHVGCLCRRKRWQAGAGAFRYGLAALPISVRCPP